MHTKSLAILGAGGHSKVVIDALSLSKETYALSLWDNNPAFSGLKIAGFTVQAPMLSLDALNGWVHIAIGNNKVRDDIAQQLPTRVSLLTIIHPAAIVAHSAHIGQGVFIAAAAILGPECQIGHGCIINHGAIVDHEVTVGAYTHIAPNSTLGGNVSIGTRVLIGAGATILPGVKFGDNAIIGAGAVVVHEVPANVIVKGIPAR
jgi:sugar O-acyltransferase (sialic acid O-acetyltransferase NeuD family)